MSDSKPYPVRHYYSAGELFPDPNGEVIRLAGLRVRVRELTMNVVAAIERDMERIAGHPDALMMPLRQKLADARASDDRNAVKRFGLEFILTPRGWPPRFGSPLMNDLLMTEAGATVFVWRALRPTHPKIGKTKCAALVEMMSADDWDALRRQLWGLRPWETSLRPAEFEKANGHAGNGANRVAANMARRNAALTGRDWGTIAAALLKHYRMPMMDVGNLFVSQVDFMLSAIDTEKPPERESWAMPTEDGDGPSVNEGA